MMDNQERFEQNLERFSFFSKKDAALLKFPKENGRVSFCENDNGELNLKVGEDFVYSRESVSQEAIDWFSKLKLDNVKILYVFGVGLGNYYTACKEWLAKDATRFLIFLEDDLDVISHFLQTELASEILHNKQVRLQYIDDSKNADIEGLDGLLTAFLFDVYKFSSLKYYQEKRSKFLENLSQYFAHFIYSKQSRVGEFLTGSVSFYINYYNNLKFLNGGYLANEMFGKFQNVPAIICGAGPSLEKNIHLLKTLEDKALIIAGGSAVNALNAYHVFPHFTAGIDPNPSQLLRILANNAYETPFFYRNRIFTESLNVNSGPKLYLTGAGGYEIPEWVEKKLHIKQEDLIDEGYNVINFSVSIAKSLGCNPIIVCGVDLAYTNNQSYLPGIKFHALHNFKQSFITKNERDELIGFKDIYGNLTSTLWKWVNESTWYAHFVMGNPKNTLINATEGGIGFANVKNMTLAEVAARYLQKTYDFDGMIQAEIQNSHFPKELDGESILKVLKLLRKSLGATEEILSDLMQECKLAARNRIAEVKVPLDPIIEKMKVLKEKLEKQDYYKYVLSPFSKNYLSVVEKRMAYFLYDLAKDDEESKKLSELELDFDNYNFLRPVMKANKIILEKAIKNYPVSNTPSKKEKKRKSAELQNRGKKYLDHEREVAHYSNNAVKSEQFIKNGEMDGPSIFYGSNGHVLASSFYEKGLKSGPSQLYYASGALYADRNFKHGLLDGKQEFYYEDGSYKSLITFKNGKLDGDVFLYYPDKKLKRELHFKEGKREGVEKMWNQAGTLIIEALYKDDKAIGVSNWFYDDGVLQQKITHNENLENYEIQRFTPEGKEIPKTVVESQDYFDKLIIVTNTIMKAIEDVFKQADEILPFLEGDDAKEAEERKELLANLKIEIEKLNQMNENIRKSFKTDALNMQEPIWKSEALKAQIEAQLSELTEVMKNEISSMQILVQKVIDKRNE